MAMKELLRKLVQAETTAHKPDEYIDIADVEKAVEYYKNIILKFFDLNEMLFISTLLGWQVLLLKIEVVK
jgi:hypothetical protein